MRRSVTAALSVLAVALATGAPQVAAQDAPGCWLARGTKAQAAERTSPLDSASVRLGGDEAKICYGAPSARGREIMGGLVPYDTPWRAGANEATNLHLAFGAEVAGVELDPGSYSVYTIPGEETWEVVLNENDQRWGIPIDAGVREADIGIGSVAPESTDDMVEQMRFRWVKHDESSADLLLEWENTRIRIPVERSGM